MPFTKLLPTSIDLAQNFAFTGTVTGTPSGGLVRVGGGASESANTGNLAFDNVFSSTYKTYLVVGWINKIADSSQVWMRVKSSAGDKTNAGYFYGFNGVNQSGTNSDITGNGDTKFRLSGGSVSNDGHTSVNFSLYFYNPASSSKVTGINGFMTETDESYVITSRAGGGEYQVAETHHGFMFTGNAQNIERYCVNVFGIKDS
jgi:hypothetical protein